MKKILFILLLLSLASSRSFARDAYDIGQGAILCKVYAKKSTDKKNDYIIWVQGFLSAFNATDPNTKNIMGDKNFFWVLDWTTKYCKDNPDKLFGEAVRDMIEELYPTRLPDVPDNPTPKEALQRIRME